MTMIGRESLPNVLEWYRGLPDVREWLKGYPKCPGVVGRPSKLSGSGGRPSWMSGSCRESLPEVWEAIPEVCEWSGHPPGCP